MLLTNSGHTDIAKKMFDYTYWLAWGTTSNPWDYPPPEDVNATQLEAEVGRVKEQVKVYVTPSDDGVIEFNNQKWAIVQEPTKYIYLKFMFDTWMNSDADIYQLGIFVDTIPNEDKKDSNFLIPKDIAYPGKLMFIENVEVIKRNDVKREIFEYIIAF